MTLSAKEKQRVIDEAFDLQNRGLIGRDSQIPIEGAAEDDRLFEVVKAAVDEYHDKVGSGKALAAGDPASQTVQPLFRGGSGAAAFAIELARNLNLEAVEGMESFDSKIRAKFAGVPEFSGKNAAVADALLRQARAILAERIVSRLMSGRQETDGGVRMLPPPLSAEFARAVKSRFKISAGQYEAWTQMPIWTTVLKGLFHRMMADGTAVEKEASPLERRRGEILAKKAWFDDMQKIGVSGKELKNYFATKIISHGSESAFRAGGWLRRFMPEIALSPATAGVRAAVMIIELEKAHAAAPKLMGRKFLGLLPNLADDLSAASIRALLKAGDNPLDGLPVFRADTILLWHEGPSVDLANRLLYLIGRNKKYTKLDEFAKHMLGTSAKALHERIDELSAEGIDVGPLKRLVDEKFSGAKAPGKKKVASDGAGKEKAAMGNTIDSTAAKPGVYKATEGDTLAKVADKTGAEITALYLQNIWRLTEKAGEYKGPVIEREVVLSFEARRGETVDALARRMHVYPAFFRYQLKQNNIAIEHKQSDSWSWEEFTQDVTAQIPVKISVPVDIAIDSGLLLVMPWAEWPLRGEPKEEDPLIQSAALFADTVEAKPTADGEAARNGADGDSKTKAHGAKKKTGSKAAGTPAKNAAITTGTATPKTR